MNIEAEAIIFLIFIVIGALTAVMFDFFRILRKTFKTPDFITHIEDVLFGIITWFLVIYSLIFLNNGNLRLYIIIGIILGIILYFLLFSKYIVNISVKILQMIKFVVSKICGIAWYPILIILKNIKKCFKITKKTKKLENNV